MITKKLIVAGFMTFACVTTALADGVGTFPEKGKTYLIHRFNNENSYIYENGASLLASPKTRPIRRSNIGSSSPQKRKTATTFKTLHPKNTFKALALPRIIKSR